MDKSKIGDIVSRKSYNSDILFRVVRIEEINNEFIYILKGISYRLQADAYESDLVPFNPCNEKEYEKDSKFGDIHIMQPKNSSKHYIQNIILRK